MIVKNYNHNLEQTAAQILKRNREERKRFDSDYTLQSGE